MNFETKQPNKEAITSTEQLNEEISAFEEEKIITPEAGIFTKEQLKGQAETLADKVWKETQSEDDKVITIEEAARRLGRAA